MSPWEHQADVHFLFGTLTVRAVHAETRHPASEFWLGVADMPDVAATMG